MCLTNKILVGLIIVALGACFYFSAITLKTHTVWRTAGAKFKATIEQEEDRNHTFKFGKGFPGDEDHVMSIPEMEMEASRLQALRGNLSWMECDVRTSQDGSVTAFIEGVNELVLPIGTRLYAFEDPEDDGLPGKYMGMFFVDNCGAGQVAMVPDPVAIKDQRLLSKITSSRGTWSIYSRMPIDSHDAFKDLDEEELADLVPKASLEEYLKDGKEDPKTGEKYERQLIAYERMFELMLDRSVLLHGVRDTESAHVAEAQAAQEVAEKQIDIQAAQQNDLRAQLETAQKEEQDVAGNNRATERYIASQRAKKQSYLSELTQKAQQIAKAQSELRKRSPAVTAKP